MPPHRAGLRLMAAAGLTLAVTAALYAFGRTHTPDYASSLFGRHGDNANVLKAQLGTALLGLALYQLVLALWMYRRLPALAPLPARYPSPTASAEPCCSCSLYPSPTTA